MIARFRCENKKRENKYTGRRRKKCRLCKNGTETLDHMLRKCEEMIGRRRTRITTTIFATDIKEDERRNLMDKRNHKKEGKKPKLI